MSTPREQYDAMLDNLDDESKLRLIEHVFRRGFASFYAEECPVDYRCGVSDYQASCDECGREFWADDPDEDAVCDTCREEMRAEEKALEADEDA